MLSCMFARKKSEISRRTDWLALCLLISCLPAPAVAGEDFNETWSYAAPSSGFHIRAERFEANPIIHREMAGMAGDVGKNINGPSLIRVPDWVENPLGKYYLYFAHHHGAFIRLAHADHLRGPWRIHRPGVLHMEDTPAYDGARRDHVASPDVHIDHENQRFVMYYHADPRPGRDDLPYQMTYAALSADGLLFESLPDPLGLFYFRVIKLGDWHYAFAKYINDGGIIYRSCDGLHDFEEGPRILPRVRHKALWKHGGMLYVFFSRGGDEPEHIMVSRIENLEDDWHDWRFTEPQTVLAPEEDFEGVDQPVERSHFGATYEFVHQLRDPAIYEEDGRVFLLYSTAGERAIAIAELFFGE